ncbi:competence/damage-inducible protein A [Alphaproteobacteria bacterium]|nr:competence/damage-inducible protein A [Alphaproteobacteria bacterium]
MSEEKIVTACLILIGNEILSGRTQDKNLAFIAKELNELGVQMREVRVIPDIRKTIVNTLNECRGAFDYIFTTGGIGPTHDDITSECIAEAFGVGMYRDPDTAALLTRRTEERGQEMNEARLRMATFPEGSNLLKNEISAAPGYRIENVFVMAGVPRIMQAMFREAKQHIAGGHRMLARGLAVDLGEGTIAEGLALVQERFRDIDIGSYPQMRQQVGFRVSVVLRGPDADILDRAHGEIMQIMRDLGGDPVDEDPEKAQASAEPEK